MKSVLRRYFDRICVINLPTRNDRRVRLEQHLAEMNLARPDDVTWCRAVAGEFCWAPGYFRAGPGAWGCLHSHVRAIQDAIMDGVDRVLILEDDVIFHRESERMLDQLFSQVPSDWDQLYLGGQHMEKPLSLGSRPYVLKGSCIHRTHAFALAAGNFGRYHQYISNYPDYFGPNARHIDHQLGRAHKDGEWDVYAPAWWIAGQAGGESDISSLCNPVQWWHPEIYAKQLPFVWIPPNINRDEKSLANGLFCGDDLRRGTFTAKSLKDCVNKPEKLHHWMEETAKHALWRLEIPAIQHGEITLDDVKTVWGERIFDARDIDVTTMLDYPFNHLFSHPINNNRQAAMKRFYRPQKKCS